MKKLALLLLCLAGFAASAQTSKELLGKWQLVRWTHNGKDKDIIGQFKTDQVFQVFLENGEFQSLVGDEVHKSKWKLSKDNSELTITSTIIIPVKFHIDYFDSRKRVISSEQMGTLEYKKVSD
ncbi:hypothetical protein FNO01nite_26420 [Flavobacterium noncentrifugens]|uniref:Lipocalin-like domain-containing protein n=1 Tax=Flavobacterium noncentrifugens TaxID=1128970 RepID=A0A1G8ZEE3_9FLAO|nr:hypothetical protein [Flavobacterium noncentrifugens]GEP51970.1 hypothetical protein FNO01nite_26420 [Flavobacterium noncentrifugens]SDK13496.1 hypothetical protein SAMN04487935_2557 [Flavobacterium noncentrifugens]